MVKQEHLGRKDQHTQLDSVAKGAKFEWIDGSLGLTNARRGQERENTQPELLCEPHSLPSVAKPTPRWENR